MCKWSGENDELLKEKVYERYLKFSHTEVKIKTLNCS